LKIWDTSLIRHQHLTIQCFTTKVPCASRKTWEISSNGLKLRFLLSIAISPLWLSIWYIQDFSTIINQRQQRHQKKLKMTKKKSKMSHFWVSLHQPRNKNHLSKSKQPSLPPLTNLS
jgi:hypothetical protein